jgi:hypothetical protein
MLCPEPPDDDDDDEGLLYTGSGDMSRTLNNYPLSHKR